MRRLRPQEKKRVGAFRLLRGLSDEHNFKRFRAFVKRLIYKHRLTDLHRRMHMKRRRVQLEAIMKAASVCIPSPRSARRDPAARRRRSRATA